MRRWLFLAVLGLAACGAGPDRANPEASPPVEHGLDGPFFGPYPWSVEEEGSLLHFGTAKSHLAVRPLDGDASVGSCPLSSDRIVVWVGPIGEWYANDSLVLVLAGLPDSPRIESFGVWFWGDLVGMERWREGVRGRVLLDPAGVDADGLLRAEVRLSEPRIRQTFAIQVEEDSASIREQLASFDSVE